jgi:hypothetical protein
MDEEKIFFSEFQEMKGRELQLLTFWLPVFQNS